MRVASGLDLDFVLPDAELRFRQKRCEAQVKDQPVGWRARRGYGNNCQRHAIYNVNGSKLCRIHAGNAVLDLLTANHPTHFYRLSNLPCVQPKPGIDALEKGEGK